MKCIPTGTCPSDIILSSVCTPMNFDTAQASSLKRANGLARTVDILEKFGEVVEKLWRSRAGKFNCRARPVTF